MGSLEFLQIQCHPLYTLDWAAKTLLIRYINTYSLKNAFCDRPLAVHVEILRKEENESGGQIAEIPGSTGHLNGGTSGKIEGFNTPVTNLQNVNGDVGLSRNGSIRRNPLSSTNPVNIPGNPVNNCVQQLRHSEGSETVGSPRSREGSTPRFHCGSMESDFVLSKAPHSIHSSFDSISMMSSVSMEKLASKVQEAEPPEVCDSLSIAFD